MNKIEEFKTQLNDTLDSWVVQGKELNFKECIIEEIIDNLKSIIQQAVSEQKEKDARIVWNDNDIGLTFRKQIAKKIREQE